MTNLIISFWLAIQSFFSCQQDHQTCQPSAANIIFRSSDGGQTWQDVSDGLPENLGVQCVYVDEREVLLGTETGVYRSKNITDALMWRKDYSMKENTSDIFPGRAGLYAHSFYSGFFQELLNTGIWIPVYSALDINMVRSILEAKDGSIFVCSENGIFKSIDNGNTWKKVYAEDRIMNIIEADGVMIGAGFKGLIRSTNNGEQWNLVLTDSGSIRKIGLIDGHFVTITNGKGDWKEIMAEPDGMANSLLLSKDGGKTWQNIDKSFSTGRFTCDLKKKPLVQFINDVEQVDGYIFCSLDTGIYRSSNHGITWELMLPSTEGKMFNFAVNGKVIYAIRASLLGGC